MIVLKRGAHHLSIISTSETVLLPAYTFTNNTSGSIRIGMFLDCFPFMASLFRFDDRLCAMMSSKDMFRGF